MTRPLSIITLDSAIYRYRPPPDVGLNNTHCNNYTSNTTSLFSLTTILPYLSSFPLSTPLLIYHSLSMLSLSSNSTPDL